MIYYFDETVKILGKEQPGSLSIIGFGKTRYPHAKKKKNKKKKQKQNSNTSKVDSYLVSFIKIKSKLIKNISIRCEIIKILENHYGVNTILILILAMIFYLDTKRYGNKSKNSKTGQN